MIFLVTGCSSGLGFALCRVILASGHKVIATSRNPAKTPEAVKEIESSGGIWVPLDVASPELESTFASIRSQHGSIDVLINNAGYAAGGALETFPFEMAKDQFDTNFFGPVRLCKAVIPSMREEKNGTIVNISSAEFWSPHPVASVYSASKFALEGFSESLAGELADFGIRVLIAEPGGMRTDFMTLDNLKVQPLPEAYKGTTTEYVMNALLALNGKQALDPKRSAEAIVKEVLEPTGEQGVKLRLPLGKESLSAMKARAEGWFKVVQEREQIALAADFPEGG